ncbi:DUF4386 domain-containing protein [Bacteroidota bacterium]
METNFNSLKKTARLAGLLYFIWVLTGIYGIIFLPSKIIVMGDAVATANKILANEFLFRTGIINDLFSATICVFMLLVLYRLFKHVNEGQAKLMVILFFLTLPVVFIMEAFNITTLMILKGEVLKTFELSQRQDLAMLFIKINDYGTLPLELFWGLWLIPFGQLVYKSGFIPRIIGVFLILNGVAYIIPCFTSLLFPNYQTLVSQFAIPFLILGEISITLWLLIKGVKINISTIE